MKPVSEATSRILELLTQSPLRLEKATRGLQTTRLYLRSDLEPWSVSDILAHLRACADVWGNSIIAMITRDNPTLRYVSPRSWMRKPTYLEQEFDAALESFTQGRQKLVKALADLDEAGWGRRGTFTGTSPRQRDQTVLSYSDRIVNHEQAHLDQIESLLG
jgi:DinB superfamily